MSSHKHSHSKQTPPPSKKQPSHLQSLSADTQEKLTEYRSLSSKDRLYSWISLDCEKHSSMARYDFPQTFVWLISSCSKDAVPIFAAEALLTCHLSLF